MAKTKKDTEKTFAKPKYFQVSIVEDYIVEAESRGLAADYVLEEMGDDTQIARIMKYPQAAEFLKAGHAVMVGHFVCPSRKLTEQETIEEQPGKSS